MPLKYGPLEHEALFKVQDPEFFQVGKIFEFLTAWRVSGDEPCRPGEIISHEQYTDDDGSEEPVWAYTKSAYLTVVIQCVNFNTVMCVPVDPAYRGTRHGVSADKRWPVRVVPCFLARIISEETHRNDDGTEELMMTPIKAIVDYGNTMTYLPIGPATPAGHPLTFNVDISMGDWTVRDKDDPMIVNTPVDLSRVDVNSIRGVLRLG